MEQSEQQIIQHSNGFVPSSSSSSSSDNSMVGEITDSGREGQVLSGYLVAIGTFLIFWGIEMLIDLKRASIESTLASKGQPKLRNWRKFNNTIISLIHASLCSVGLIISLALYPSLRRDLVFETRLFPYLLISFSAGYFTKDFLTNLLKRDEFGRKWTESSEILLHHVVCVLDMTISLSKLHYTGGLLFALLAEINNTFLHARSLILMGIGVPQNGTVFRIISAANLITNIIFRCLPNFFLAYRFIFNSPSGDSDRDQFIPIFDLSLIIFSLLLLMTYQSVMFFRILERDLKGPRHRHPQTKLQPKQQPLTDPKNK